VYGSKSVGSNIGAALGIIAALAGIQYANKYGEPIAKKAEICVNKGGTKTPYRLMGAISSYAAGYSYLHLKRYIIIARSDCYFNKNKELRSSAIIVPFANSLNSPLAPLNS
jgi:hypothetical protein